MTDVSIIIITWKMKSLIQRLLSTISELSHGFSYEIIVIENNSQDGTIEMIEESFKDVCLIKNATNLGVAKARNQGLKIAKGRFILILDADMELIENSIEKMINYMDENKNIGLLGSKLIAANGALQFSCKRFPNLFALIARRLEMIPFIRNSKTLNNHLMKDWIHDSIKEVDYLIGACQLIRRDVITKIGYYDDNIFYGPEDIDYCLRVWRAGWKVVYFPNTQIIHHEQRITKKSIFSQITVKHICGIYYIFNKYNGKLSRE
jgi:GT2 family glycosyltransferase